MASHALVEGVSGALGGIVATVATYPLMTVNTLQATRVRESQQREEREGEEGGTEAVAAEAAAEGRPLPLPRPRPLPPVRRSTLGEMAALVNEGGVAALFRGIQASLVGTTVSQAIYYYWYSVLRRAAVERRAAALGRELVTGADLRSADITVAESLMVAAAAGCINVLATNPIWLLATRMQASHQLAKQYADEGLGEPSGGVVRAARDVLHEYGPLGFWNGVGASLVMVVNPTIQYALYEYLLSLRSALARQRGRRNRPPPRPSALEVFLLSALAKAGATVLTYPLLIIKTRMYAARKGGEMQYASIADAVRQIGAKEGLGGYYKGMRTKIVQSVLAAALLFVAKEQITDFTRAVLLRPVLGKAAVAR
eukprot:scaffold6.g2640.t1